MGSVNNGGHFGYLMVDLFRCYVATAAEKHKIANMVIVIAIQVVKILFDKKGVKTMTYLLLPEWGNKFLDKK